jgi:amidase
MSFRACNYRGYTLTHRDWFAFDQRRIRLRMAWEQFFQRVDLLICPVASTSAFKHNQAGQRWERMLEVNGQMREGTEPMFWAGYPGMIGLPATAFPLGTDANGLPIGSPNHRPRLCRSLGHRLRGFPGPRVVRAARAAVLRLRGLPP